jgi:hypothetical protein
MKKFIAILIALIFLMPAVSMAGDRRRGRDHRDKYKVYTNKHVRAHKEDRYAPVHPRFKRGHTYKYRNYHSHHPFHYRRHYTWREWYGGPRYQHPHGAYHRSEGQLMFSYCENGLCFSFSIGD